MAWKNIPDKKVLATLKDGKDFKGTAAEKMTIYVDGGVPGSEGDVKGISVTVDPSTYIMTTQLKDSKGGNVGSPATVDLPLESMVVGGEYDAATKKVILTLKNGETVEFSVADLVAGLQSEITPDNPLDANLINDENSDKKLVTPEEKEALNSIVENDFSRLARFEDTGDVNNTALTDNAGNYLQFEGNRQSSSGEISGITVNNNNWSYFLQNGAGSPINLFAGNEGVTYLSGLPCGLYEFDADSMTLYVTDDKSQEITQDGTLIAGSEFDSKRTFTFIPADGSPAINYILDINTGEVEEKTVGGSGTVLYTNIAIAQVADSGHYDYMLYDDDTYQNAVNTDKLWELTNAGPVVVRENSSYGESNYIFTESIFGGGSAGISFVITISSEKHYELFGYEGAPELSVAKFTSPLVTQTTGTSVENVMSQKAVTQALNGKANTSAIPTKVSQLTNNAGYQNASQVSSAIASAVSGITSFEYQVVQTLPQTGVKGVVYLVANSGTTPNIYDEYIWVNDAFEKIGTTEMDLSNYYTKTQTDTLLGAKADQSTTYTKTEVDTALGNKANSSNVYTKTQVDTALGNKANSSDVYSKSEVNTALAGKQDTIDANHKLDADLIDNSTSDNKTYETGTGAPTTSTAGSVGELYVDKSTGTVYVCTGVDGGVYTWTEITVKDRVKTLTTADYNYPTSGTKTSIALWLLPSGVYDIGEALDYKPYAYGTTTTTGKDENHFIIINRQGVATVIEDFSPLGIMRYSTNASTGANEGYAKLAFVDNLNTTDTSRGLTAKQGKVLNDKIPVITMTSTDPGEGSALEANHFIAVYEV